MRLLVATLMMISFSASALDSTNVLPKGIHSPSLKYGLIGNIGQQYSNSGSLETLSDANTISFDAKTLIGFVDEERSVLLSNLVSAINGFSPVRAGDALHLGFLMVDTKPEIDYWAPVYAVGVTDKVTVAVGIPVLNYTNNISLRSFGSNLGHFQSFKDARPEIADGIEQLADIDVNYEVRSELSKQGYKPLESRSDSFIGDIQLVTMYKFMDKKSVEALSRTTVVLPTGPKDNPDDLLDLNIFGETAIDQQFIAAYKGFGKTRLLGKGGLRLYLPDQLDVRVPESETDILPGLDSKEKVDRLLGPKLNVGGTVVHNMTDSFAFGAGLDASLKMRDQYKGSRGGRYDLLSNETDGHAVTFRIGADYSTVAAYQQQLAEIPFIVSYEYSDVIMGRNLQRQTINEFWLTMFF